MPIFDLRNCPLISAATDDADEGGSSERSTDTQVGVTDRNVPFCITNSIGVFINL